MHNSGQNGLTSWILPVFFVVLIFATLIGTFFHWDFYPLQNENHPMAAKPDFKNSPLTEWPDKINAWYKDHFGFRNTFIRRYNAISRDWFKRQPNSVLMSDKGWLFTTKNGAIADFMGVRVLSETELEQRLQNAEGKQKWLKKQGINFLWVIPPNKCLVYPEELPKKIQKARKRNGIDQLLSYLDAQGSQLNRLDLRPVLLANKSAGVVYHSTDTHWNPLGSYIGYCSIIKEVQHLMPEIRDFIPLNTCTITTNKWTGDLISFVGDGKNRDIDYIQIEPPAGNVQIVESKWELPEFDNALDLLITHNPNGHGTAIIFHDSFGGVGWRKFFPHHFRKSIFLLTARAKIELFEQVIDTYHPDIIIEEQVQRNLIYKKQPTSQIWVEAFNTD